MPTVNPNETRNDFTKRCIPIVLKDGTAKDNKQAIAICYSMYAEHKKKERPGKTSAVTKKGPIACLRGPTVYSDKSVVVDEAAGVIKNVSLMTVGPASGHGFEVDQTSIEQMMALASAKGPDGVKSRFRHPEITETRDPVTGDTIQTVADDTGTQVGRIRNVRIEGTQLRGDIYLGNYAAMMPGLGNVRDYLLCHAKDDPAGIGMSAMFNFEVEPETDQFGNVVKCLARITDLTAIDFVSVPAANPMGLLSAKALFDPRPPSGTPDAAGWQDAKPDDRAKAPIPAGTPEFPNDLRGDYLVHIAKHGPMPFTGLLAKHSGRLEEMRASADWLVSNGYATKSTQGKYAATAKGMTYAAMRWKQ